MQPTPRLRVLSDRILRVLVFVYFCKGLSGNTEERPTRRVYIQILTCHIIFYHLEDSRSHRNEREDNRARRQGARPTLLGARPPSVSNPDLFRGSCSTDLRDQGKPYDWCRFDPRALIHLKRLYKQGLLAPGDHTSSTESKLGFQFFIQLERIPLVHLVLPLIHLVLVLVHLVLVLVPLVLVLVSSSCNLENKEREEESGGGARSVGSSSTLYFCSNWFILHHSPSSSIHNSWVL